MPTLGDLKFTSLRAQGYTGTINDMEWKWLADQTGRTDLTINGQWYELLTSMGYSGTIHDMQVESWAAIYGQSGHYNDLEYWFWGDGGGSYGPSVSIQRNNDPGFCEFEPPTTADCTASETYTANDFNFTNPANTWLWTIEPPVVGVNLTNATAKTCTVTTVDADANVEFNLKVVATDSVSSDTADRTNAITQNHTDINETPVFIGPEVNDVQFTKDQPLTPFDTTILFTGTNLVYDYVGTLPAGLTYVDGILAGTPTEDAVESLSFTATNSKGVASSNTFTMTVITVGQTLEVSELAAGSCTWMPPATDCVASGQYIATPTGYSPDTWVWSVTTGVATITAGQGTDTVTVETDDAENVTFTLKCVASVGATTAQDLTQFTQTHGEESIFTDIFVDPSIAADTGTGTVSDPYGDLEYAIIQETFDTTIGTRLNIKAGTAEVLSSSLEVALADTSVSPAWVTLNTAPLVFQGYTTEAGDGGIGEISGGGLVTIISHTTYNFVTFKDLKFGDVGNRKIATLNDDIVVENCEVHSAVGTSGGGLNFDIDCQFIGNYIHDVGSGASGYGILTIGNALISHNTIVNSGAGINMTGNDGFVTFNIVKCSGANIGIAVSGESYVANNSVWSDGGTGSGVKAVSAKLGVVLLNNIVEGFSGSGGVGIDCTNMGNVRLRAGNSTYDNETNVIVGATEWLEFDNEVSVASKFTDAANGDFSPTATSGDAYPGNFKV